MYQTARERGFLKNAFALWEEITKIAPLYSANLIAGDWMNFEELAPCCFMTFLSMDTFIFIRLLTLLEQLLTAYKI